MNDLLQLISSYSLVQIVVILILCYSAGSWVIQQFVNWKDKISKSKKDYHEEQAEIENKDKELERRFNSIEEHIEEDYERIKQSESHLYQIENSLKELRSITLDMRIQSLRKQILDFTHTAVNLTNSNISREAYDEIDRVYKEYESLLHECGKENGLVDYSYKCILHSYASREKGKLFLEDFYISPVDSLNRMSENGTNIEVSDEEITTFPADTDE